MSAVLPFSPLPSSCPKCESTDIHTRWRPAFGGCGCSQAWCQERDPRPEHLEHVCRRCTYGWKTETAEKAAF